jgi:hypothetical protein
MTKLPIGLNENEVVQVFESLSLEDKESFLEQATNTQLLLILFSPLNVSSGEANSLTNEEGTPWSDPEHDFWKGISYSDHYSDEDPL